MNKTIAQLKAEVALTKHCMGAAQLVNDKDMVKLLSDRITDLEKQLSKLEYRGYIRLMRA